MKEFKVSSWSIDNKTSIYVLTIILSIFGLMSYFNMPKEQFPEIVFPQMYVATIYPGTSPSDMEKLVTKHIEKQVKGISGVKKITSNSIQDYSSVLVEFNTDVDVNIAKQKVKDAVDQAKNDLPTDLPDDPQVIEVDVSQVPIMGINLSGDYELSKLKKYADDMQDQIESMREIRRVDIIGAPEREIQINVDKYKMEAANITFSDIERAVQSQNLTISGGTIKMDGIKRNITVTGEFDEMDQINNLLILSQSGAKTYLKDILENGGVKDTYKEAESFARLNGKNVITLNVIKRGGMNLIDASDKIQELIANQQKTKLPDGLKITITGDQSDATRTTLHDLINTIIIGFILVVIILMFFMGTTNAIFVGLSVPLSMAIAFIVLPTMGITLNMIVLFAFLLALGIVVDDAIVVIENTHRIYENGKVPIKQAAKQAAGEVFMPVFSGTMTTLAPFVPLLFWKGIIGKFMYFLPVTLIVTLLASLLVAYIINPVFAVDFMKPHAHDESHKKITRGYIITMIVFAVIALLGYAAGSFGFGNFVVVLALLYSLNKFVLIDVIQHFQDDIWPGVQNKYEKVLEWCLVGARPFLLLGGIVFMFIFSIILTGIVKPKVVFFPSSDPNFIYAYINLPIGTDQSYTDSISQVVENRIFKVIGHENPIVSSVITNVAIGAGDANEMDLSTAPHKAKVTVAFVEFAHRKGESTVPYLGKIREAVKGIPGTQIIVDQEQGGPPTGKEINIEIIGDDYDELIEVSEKLKRTIDNSGIQGIEDLKSDVVKNKPEIVIDIDKEKANAEGVSVAQIGMELRYAVFGKDVSKFRDKDDEYDIELRYTFGQRTNIDDLMNSKITFRDMNMGGAIRQIPLSSIAKARFDNSYGGIKRKNQRRIVTLSSNVLSGANSNEINAEIKKLIPGFKKPTEVLIQLTGAQEEQAETGAFLGMAMLTSFIMILFILVTQFNSISKPLLIISEIGFSVIGVLLGVAIFGMSISVVMTGVGIIALAGIVVRNGIILVEFTDIIMEEGHDLKYAIVHAGKVRMTPVLLTATATILGLIPLAVGLNIDFVRLFAEGNPHIFFGGDSVAFWGPLAWTMIHGLAFATFLTLILVPIMYYINYKASRKIKGWFGVKVEKLS
ncbi:efflux RND transporter permease subunit [Cytophaga hutchinsonii]|nr:efflux RND transporter permease subunit [Cytophaga hutchinsonii]SFX64518.1 Multidrug efflux pump subunit AcrB [Cytophaga hutchinsonii ATCC 33406]